MKALRKIENKLNSSLSTYIFYFLSVCAFAFFKGADWTYGWIAELYPMGENFITLMFAIIVACAVIGILYLILQSFKKLSNLTSIDLPSDLRSIGKETFYFCVKLENISIPDTVKSIGAQAFYRCPADFDLPKGLTSVGSKAFEDSGLTKAVFQSPVVLKSQAFYEANNLREVVLPEKYGATYTGAINLEEYTFYDCDKLESVTISANMQRIQDSAFEYCNRLKTVTIPEDSQLMTIGSKAFRYCYNLNSIKLPNTVTSIYDSAFYDCRSLKSINLQDTKITEVYDCAFAYTALESIKFPETLTGFRSSAFRSTNITKIELSEKISELKSSVFKDSPITEVTVYNPNFNFYDNTFSGEETTIIGYKGSTAAFFAGENNMKFVALEGGEPDNSIPTSGTFEGGTWIVTSMGELVISGEGDIASNTVCDNDSNEYTFAKIAELNDVNSVIICNGITSLPEDFMYGTEFLTDNEMTLTLPDSLVSIGNNAFKNTNLTSVDIPDSVTAIGDYAFYEAGLSGGVKLSNSLTAINQYAFAGNDFSSLEIPNSVTEIKLGAFNNCKNLVDLYIPQTVTTIEEGSSSTKPIGFTSTGDKIDVTTIECKLDSRAYQYAVTNGINTILDMEDGYISGYYFSRSCAKWYYYPDTKEFYFVSKNVKPSNSTFYYSNGTTVKSGELEVDKLYVCFGVTDFSAINSECIFKIFNPKYISLPDSLTSIGNNAFSGLRNLKSVAIPDTVTTLSATSFNNCNIEAISFGNGLKAIPDYLFKDNKALKYVDFGNVGTIGTGSFQSCTALEEIVIPSNLTAIGENAFAKCLSVKSVTIEYGKDLTIGDKAFADLPLCDTVKFNRTNVTYPEGAYERIFRNLGSSTSGICLYLGDKNDASTHSTDLALFNNKKLVEINVGKYINEIKNIKCFPNLKNVSVDEENELYFSYGSCLYQLRSNGQYNLLLAPAQLTEVEICDNTRQIHRYAFYESNIKSIEIPEGVTLIGDYVFYNCKELRRITFPSTLQSICHYCFANCTKLKVIDLPSCNFIYSNAFENCTSLASILLPDNLHDIDPEAFKGCTSLTGFVMPNNNSYLYPFAFENCSSLKDVYMWNNDFQAETFAGCDNVVIHTLVGSDSYNDAKEYGLNIVTYTDENVFADQCAMMEDIYEGYIGFCDDGHGDIQYLTVYEPTCEQDGYIIGVCEYCSVILEEIHIEATGHKYEKAVTIDPTETTVGVEKYTCTACGDSYCVYSPALGGDTAEKTLCNITGKTVIANSKSADTGVTPLKSVSVKLGDETLATTDSNGNFSFSLETGVYELTLWYNYGFERTVYLVVEDKDVDIGSVPMIACDWNKDGKIDDGDMELFKLVISSKEGDPAYLDYVDMNNDGKIDVKDLVYMNYVKGLNKETFTYPSIVAEAKF